MNGWEDRWLHSRTNDGQQRDGWRMLDRKMTDTQSEEGWMMGDRGREVAREMNGCEDERVNGREEEGGGW